MGKQHERILQYLDEFGSISPMEAFSDLGITKLSTRIGEMIRKGVKIEKTMEVRKNRFGEKVSYMRYTKGE